MQVMPSNTKAQFETQVDQDLDVNARSNEFLKKSPPKVQEQAAQTFFTSSLTSMKVAKEESNSHLEATSAQEQVKKKPASCLNRIWQSITEMFSGKANAAGKIDLSQNPKQKITTSETEATKNNLQTRLQSKKIESSKAAPVEKEEKGFFTKVWDWVKDKWNSFLEFIGVRSSQPLTTERDRSNRSKILQRTSPHEDLKDDFKYIDITNMDPLKAMIHILVKQGQLRQEEAFLLTQRILLMQEDLKDLHHERMFIHAEIEAVDKKMGTLNKWGVAFSIAQVLGLIASVASVAISAASVVVTGGATAPLAIAITGFNVANGGLTTANTWMKGSTKEKQNELHGKYGAMDDKRKDLQYVIKFNMKDMKNALESLANHAETGTNLIAAAQYKGR
jgi:hypothetical protein